MSFDEAINAKKNVMPELFMGLHWIVFVVPEDPQDFENYKKSVVPLFFQNLLTDNHAKMFSSNGSFVIKGLTIKGAIILHRSITINP